MAPILHSRPWIDSDDEAAVTAVLRSGMIAQGETALRFEAELSRWIGVGHPGVCVGSGTAALTLALLALKLDAEAEVIVPTYVCHSVLEALRTAGATPVICDVGPQFVLTPESVSAFITRKTKAIIIPHVYGIFADVAAFRKWDVTLIEDFAQAVDLAGARALIGDIGVFSFHPTKCLTTGEGGMAVARDPDLTEHMRRMRDGSELADAPRLCSPFSDVAAALGLSQLKRYDRGVQRREVLADGYFNALGSQRWLPALTRKQTMWFRFPLRLPGGTEIWRQRFLDKGVHVRKGVDRLLHRIVKLSDKGFPVATAFFEETVSVPIYPMLTDGEHAHCVAAIQNLLLN